MVIENLLEIGFGLAYRKIIDPYHIRFMDFEEVIFYHNRVAKQLEDEEAARKRASGGRF